MVFVEAGEVSLVSHVAPEHTFSTWLGASSVFFAVSRTISTSFCEGLHAALSAGDSVKVIPVDPVFDVDAVTTPEP
jgi:hypothetical protein